MHPSSALCSIVVAIPARDEADKIAACLEALGRQTHLPTAVVLLLNNCTDTTETVARHIALPFFIDIWTVRLSAAEANSGTARRLAMERAAVLAGQAGIVMTTDADAVVPAEWVAQNIRALRAGADVVCGQATVDPLEAESIPRHLRDDDARECEYSDLLDAIAETLCPDPADPWPHHSEASGASLAITVKALRLVGGVPRVATGEDRALVSALSRIDARIRHDPKIRVTVSGRIVGRAAGGMADTIRRRMVHQDEFVDARLEPAGDAFRRADFRRRVRTAWAYIGGDLDLAADLHLSSAALDRSLQEQFFGTAWAQIERRSPMLPFRPVRFVDLPQHIEVARELLFSLRTVATHGSSGDRPAPETPLGRRPMDAGS